MPQPDGPAEVDNSPDVSDVGVENLADSRRELQESPQHSIVVGVGASAGGLEALSRLLGEMPATLGTTFVVVQHLDPNHRSALAELLAKKTSLPVTEVQGDTAVERDHVYVIPPNRYLTIEDQVLRLSIPTETRGTRSAIDHFFRSLAKDRGPQAVGIILSGTGADGTAGLKEIKDQGGLSIVQDPDEAGHEGMPRNAIRSLQIDFVLPVDQIPQRLAQYVWQASNHGPLTAPMLRDRAQDHLQAILQLLKEQNQHDFSSFRKTTLLRRIHRRMGVRQLVDLVEYRHFLADNPLEVNALACDLLIGVTQFFRDPAAWETLNENVLSPLMESATDQQVIRAWCPGCATGEEAYTLAILLHEQRMLHNKHCRIQIFASDIVRDAIEFARRGIYPQAITSDVLIERRRRFFVKGNDEELRVSKGLRESVIFAEQDILSHAPFSNLDLICCRNLLIYLKPEAQKRLTSVFDFALKPGGHLFLGNAEALKSHQEAFSTVSEKWRIFRHRQHEKRLIVDPHEPLIRNGSGEEVVFDEEQRDSNFSIRVARQLIRESESGIAVVAEDGRVLYLQGRVDHYLQLALGETLPARPNVLDLARQGIRSKLRSLIHRTLERRQRTTAVCRVHREGIHHRCSITVRPLEGGGADERSLLVSFDPIPSSDAALATGVDRQAPYEEASLSRSDVSSTEETVNPEGYRALRHELATVREQLNSSIKDLETVNEELRASNDEAMSTNEELQSSNEELETSREELQSLNEELTTLNHQLETKLAELQQTTDDRDNLLTSSSVPTLFLDLDFRIRLFTPSCRSLFHLIESDTGRPLSDIAKRFDDNSLLEDAADVIRDLRPRQKRVHGKNHCSHLRVIRPYRTDEDRIQGVVITFADVTELQRIEQKWIRQRDEIDTIYRTASVGLCVLDRELRYVRINERLAEINGMPADQHLGMTIREVVPNLADTMEPILRQIFETGEAIHDLEIRGETRAAPGAERIWVEDWTPLTDPEGNVVAVNGVAVEVTQHRRAEQHLRESENRLRLAARAARFGYYDSDLMSGVVYWSPEMRKIVDYPLDAPVNIRAGQLPDFIHPEDRQRVEQETAASLDPRGNGEIESEHRIVQRSGEERWLLMRGITLFEQQADNRVPVRTIGVVVDIHHRRLAEERLRESEHRFRALVEATAQLVWTADAEGKAIQDSSSWREFTGQSTDQFRGSGWLDAVHPDDRQRTQNAWQEAIRQGVPYEADYRLRHRDGEYRWMSSRAAPIRDSEQAIRGWIGMNSDISERKEFERALQEARKRAEVANQSKSDFLANMSHEIRTPMTAILGYADLLAENLDDPYDLQNIETIRRNGRFLLEIVNDILDLSKIEAEKMEVMTTEVSPEAVICEVVSLMNVRAEEKEIPLKLETIGKLPETIKCDGVRLRQILLNLVGNAIKFTEEGEVRLIAELLPDEEQIRFDIVDTGIGIGEEQQGRLFQPFNQADNSITRSHGGTGLGLAISQRLANLLGGSLHVHSTPGRGSKFSVTVSTGPLENVNLIEPQMGKTIAAISQESSSLTQLDCCVLVVDDRRDIRFLAHHFLQGAGARVELCENGQQAIERLTAEPGPPPIDVVIMDISMPVMDGYTAASRLRQAGITLPIIALTANAMEGDRDKCLASGFTDYTTKPLNKQSLVEMVARYTTGSGNS